MFFLAVVVIVIFGFALLSKVNEMDRRLMALESKLPKTLPEQNGLKQNPVQQNEARQNASPQTSIQPGVVHHDVSPLVPLLSYF